MTDNDKWLWADEEDTSPQAPPLLEEKLTPIVEWAEAQPKATPEEPQVKAREEPAPARDSVASPSAQAQPPQAPPARGVGARRSVPPSVVKAIVLHLEGKVEEAIQEIQKGLQSGEPPVELYTAIGALQLELGRFEDAASSYRQVLAREPANAISKQNLALCEEKLSELKKPPKPPPSLVKAIVLHMEKRLDDAIKELNRGIKAGEQTVDVYAALGHLQFEVGRFDAAAEAYTQVLKREPLHQSCHYNLAVCLEKLGRHKDAFASFQKAFEINSKRVEMGIGVGVSLLHLKRFADAAAAFEACLRSHPDDEAGLFGKAFALQSAGSLAEAETAYGEVLKRNPAQEEALVNLIAVTVAQKKEAGAREYCGKLLAIRPDSRIALETLIALDLAAGNYGPARLSGEALTRIAADSFEAWFNYGIACHGDQRTEDAAAAFSKAARMRPKSLEALSSLGQALQNKGDLAGAKSAYESALKISSDNPAVLWNLVQVSEQTGSTRDAEKYCAALAAKSPKSDVIAFRLGSLRFQLGDYPGSVDAFRNSLKNKPDLPTAQLNLGLALWRAGNHEEARQKLEAVTAPPYAIEALHHLVMIAIERKDYLGALGCCMRLSESGERSHELHYNTGLILQNLGRPDEAATQFREALAAKPDLSEAAQALALVSRPALRNDESRKNGSKDSAPAPQLLKSR